MLPLSMLSLCPCYSFDVNFFEVDVPVVDVSYFPPLDLQKCCHLVKFHQPIGVMHKCTGANSLAKSVSQINLCPPPPVHTTRSYVQLFCIMCHQQQRQSIDAKTDLKMLVKLSPEVNYTNVLLAAFVPIFFCQNISNPNC